MRTTATFIATLILVALPAITFAFLGIEMAVGGWQQDPSGNFGYKMVGVDDKIDLENDAHYDDAIKLFGRVKLDLPLFFPNIYVMATPMDFDGNGSKNVNFNFGGVDFALNTPFYSEATLDHYDVALYWGIPMLKTATMNSLDIEFGINVRYIDFEGTITQNSLGRTETASESLAVPMVYLGVEFTPVKWLAIQAEARGISYSDNSYYDYIGRVKYKPFLAPLFVAAGYRYEDIDVDESSIRVDAEFSGPFAEVGLQF